MDSYLPIDDAGPVTQWTPHADQVDDIAVEKTTAGFHDDVYTPGTLGQEYDNGGINNQWDESFPKTPGPLPTSGHRGGGHKGP
jgi:hypothetical protein